MIPNGFPLVREKQHRSVGPIIKFNRILFKSKQYTQFNMFDSKIYHIKSFQLIHSRLILLVVVHYNFFW